MLRKFAIQSRRTGVLLAGAITLLAAGAASAATLVTREEAALASAKVVDGGSRGIARGPIIEQVSPAPGALVTAPFRLTVTFSPRNDVPVEPASATLIYGKAPLQDITERAQDYMTAAGIDIPAVEMPAGEHWLRFRVRDEHLHWTTAWIKITVVKQAADAAGN